MAPGAPVCETCCGRRLVERGILRDVLLTPRMEDLLVTYAAWRSHGVTLTGEGVDAQPAAWMEAMTILDAEVDAYLDRRMKDHGDG